MTQELKFSECTLLKLEKLFGITLVDKPPVLTTWLRQRAPLSKWERQSLIFFQNILIHNVHSWNEIELIQNFIGPVFALADFASSKKFNYFAERDLIGQVDGITLYGNPDGMIASGFREPETPFFCFQEYKRHLDPKGDPAGQALAAMLVAQELNQAAHPIYGASVIGEIWQFMTLQGREYSLSTSYVATNGGLFDIFRILKVVKQYVMEWTSPPILTLNE